MGRWQLSTFTLAPVIWGLSEMGITNSWIAAFVGNFFGALIFYWVDRLIFRSEHYEIWETTEGKCDSCGWFSRRLWRLVKTPLYNKEAAPAIFLCEKCSAIKIKHLESKGIKVKKKHSIL
jgi:membrane protein DedA with SNARE-associated domain